MVEFQTHQELIKAWEDGGRPLDDDSLWAINRVSKNLDRLGYNDKWLVFDSKCRICNYESTIICPALNDSDNQECGNCGHDTAQVKEIPEWEEEEYR